MPPKTKAFTQVSEYPKHISMFLRGTLKKAEVTLSSKHQENKWTGVPNFSNIIYHSPPKNTVHELRFVDFTYRHFIYLGLPALKEEKEEKKLSIIYDIYRNVEGFFKNEIQVSFGGYCFTVSHLPEIVNSTDRQWASDMLKSGTGVLLSQHSKRPPLFPYFPCLSSLIKVGFSLQDVQEAGATKGKRDKNIQEACLHLHNLTFHNE